MRKRADLLLFVLLPVIVLAALAVFLDISTAINGMSLDGDECILVNLVSTNSWSTLFHAVRHDSNPPLMYIIAKLWSMLFGTTDLAFKSLAITIAASIPPAAFLVMRKRLGFAPALVVGLLCALSPPLIDISTRVRPYGLMILLGFLSTVALDRLLKQPAERRSKLVYAVSIVALLYTHVSSILVPMGHAFAVLVASVVRRDKELFKNFAIAALIAGVFLIPLAEAVIFGIRGDAQPWKSGQTPDHILQLLPTTTFNVVEPGILESMLHETWVPMVIFWGTLVLAGVLFKSFRTALPDFVPEVWVLSLFGMVAVEFVIATQVFRVAYVGHLIVPTLVLLVASLCTAFAGRHAKLGYVLPLLLPALWIPDLKKMHDIQEPTMRNLFESINKDQAATGKKSLVVFSHEWYGPAAYRYLNKDIPFICFPDIDSPVAYLDWIGYSTRIQDNSKMVKLLETVDDKLKNGYCVYHMYLDIHGGKRLPLFPRTNFIRAVQVQKFLLDHARLEKSWDSSCYQVPGILDVLKTNRFCR